MLRRKKKDKVVETTETELPLQASAQAPTDQVEEVIVETVEESPVEEAPASAPVEVKAVEETVPAVESPDDTLAKLTNTLNAEFKKLNNGLTAHIAKVSNNLTYVLIKAANSAYCFGRIGTGKEGSRAALELEFLSNVPADAHRNIFEICKSLDIQDSKRLFFHPSGIL